MNNGKQVYTTAYEMASYNIFDQNQLKCLKKNVLTLKKWECIEHLFALPSLILEVQLLHCSGCPRPLRVIACRLAVN